MSYEKENLNNRSVITECIFDDRMYIRRITERRDKAGEDRKYRKHSKMYAYTSDGTLKEVPSKLWHIQEENGTEPAKLSENTLYEVHIRVEDGGAYDLSGNEKEIKASVVLGK